MTLIWAGLAVVLLGFEGSILIIALPAVATDFHAGITDLAGLGSVLEIGALGGLPLAALADRFGRRRLVAAGTAGFSVMNFASAYVPSLAGLATLHLFAVACYVVVGAATTSLIVEEAPAEHRGLAVSALALLSGAGMGITTITYPIIAPHWRWLFVACAAGVLAAPLIWFLLPEGRTWKSVLHTEAAPRLLLQAPWRRRTAVLGVMNALLNALLVPAGLLYTLYASRNLGWSPAAISILIVVAAAAGVIGFPAGGLLTDRFGRRAPAIALTIASAAATSFSFATPSGGFFTGIVLWSAFASAATPVFGSWTGELFPTRARATAEAAMSIAVALGGIAGLQVLARLAGPAGLGGAIELEGVAGVAGALLLFLLPETRQQPLPE